MDKRNLKSQQGKNKPQKGYMDKRNPKRQLSWNQPEKVNNLNQFKKVPN